ncbi:histidinol dehydrogenase [soil metagenome]
MRMLSSKTTPFEDILKGFERRARPAASVRDAVAEIVEAVRERGDAALFEFAERFDRVTLTAETLGVSGAEFAGAEEAVGAEVKEMIALSHANVRAFAERSLRQDWSMENAQGAVVGEVFQPFERVGIYVPGGSAPLVSTAIMTATLAAAAGVPEMVACTPCSADGAVNPALLHALKLAGVTEVYKVGGAHAIAALALGTGSIRPVAKVFGPGNPYVVEAKRQLFGEVAIDLLPGPSEILVLADRSADARFVAADLLAQAEHGGDSEVVLVTDSPELVGEVESEIVRQAATLGRAPQITKVLENGCRLVLVGSLEEEGVRICNAYAPEHLSLVVADEEAVLPKIRTAGAIFVGSYAPVAVGDFLAGPSHTLPTGGAGKSFPGLTAEMFQRRTSIVRIDRQALARSAPVVQAFSEVEGLDAHGRSASIRLE